MLLSDLSTPAHATLRGAFAVGRLRALSRAAVVSWVMVLPAAFPALAATMTPGAAMPAIQLEDQHGRPLRVDAGTQRLLFSCEKSVNDLVSKTLLAQPAGVLERQQTVYVADISGMPVLVTRLFALPRLREQPFAVGLVREAAEQAQVADIPRQPGAATVLRFVDGHLTEIHLARNEAQLRAALGLEP